MLDCQTGRWSQPCGASEAPRVTPRYQGKEKPGKRSLDPFIVAYQPFTNTHGTAKANVRRGASRCLPLAEQCLSGAAYLRVLELRVEGEEDVQRLDPTLVHGDVQDGYEREQKRVRASGLRRPARSAVTKGRASRCPRSPGPSLIKDRRRPRYQRPLPTEGGRARSCLVGAEPAPRGLWL